MCLSWKFLVIYQICMLLGFCLLVNSFNSQIIKFWTLLGLANCSPKGNICAPSEWEGVELEFESSFSTWRTRHLIQSSRLIRYIYVYVRKLCISRKWEKFMKSTPPKKEEEKFIIFPRRFYERGERRSLLPKPASKIFWQWKHFGSFLHLIFLLLGFVCAEKLILFSMDLDTRTWSA